MNASCVAVCDILDSTSFLKSKFLSLFHTPAPTLAVHLHFHGVQNHDPHNCLYGSGAVRWWYLLNYVLMAAADDELQKLGKPPIYIGKEDEWNEWSFVMRSYVSLLSAHVPALLAGAEDASPDMSITRIRTTLTDEGVAAA